jgi:hypothetical protein
LPASVRQEAERSRFVPRSSYGGNTTCVEELAADTLPILDCGSGRQQLSVALVRR